MSRLQVFIVFLALVFIALSAFYYFVGFSPQRARLHVESQPTASVFVDGKEVGVTPFEGTFPQGEAVVRLVPQNQEFALVPYEVKVNLVNGIKTVVIRSFGETEDNSWGQVISFDKTGGTEASLSIVSIPDAASVRLDGQAKGFTPIRISRITPAEHQVMLSAEGYIDNIFSINAVEGYRITIIAKLAVNPSFTPATQASPEPVLEKIATILPTPTGFLRVRSEPSVSATEIAQIKPGEKYPYTVTSDDGKWYRIELEDQPGWVSNQYASISAEPKTQ